MADCSYARCLQERRSIKRELQRWTKNMVYVVGLERVAEELMGRRKWKLYQDVLLARNLPLQQPDDNEPLSDSSPPEEDDHTHMIATTEAVQRHTPAVDLVTDQQDQCQKSEQYKSSDSDIRVGSPIVLDEEEAKADVKEDGSSPAPKDENQSSSVGVQSVLKIKTIEQINTTTGVDAGLNPKDGGGSEASETILEGLIKRTSSGPPRRPLPVDWTPQDKCYFCVDGELVRPGATNAPEPAPEQAASPVESESESSSSRSGTSPPRNQFLLNQQAQALAQLFLQQQARLNPSMNQVQSMTASLAAIAALGGGTNLPSALALCPPALLPHWYLNARVNTPERGPVDNDKSTVTGNLSSPLTTEQPLDLSSKASAPNSSEDLKPPHGEGSSSTLESRLANLRVPPQLFKSKPRIVPPTGRRAYSEAELQAALRDIQSGKLGTRRAAVLYNIPRSTLRNKVYKLERERESRLPGSLPSSIDRDDSNDIGDELDDDKDSLMDDDKEEDREMNRPLLSMEDILRFSQMDNTTENLQKLLQKGGQKFFDMESPKRDAVPDLWSCMDPSTMTPYIQSFLMANALGKPEESTLPMPEIARLLAEEQRNILKEQLLKHDHLNNGKPSEQSEDDTLNKRLFSRQSSSASSVITKNERSTPGRKTDSPEEPMEIVDQDGCGESRDSPSNVILKIPSFKPLATTPNSNKNGGEAFSGPATPPHPYFSHSPHPDQSSTPRASDHLSPPLVHVKGQSFSIKDVIAKSISQKFQQHVPPTNHNDLNQMSKLAAQNAEAMESLNAYKRGGLTPPMGSQNISVIKNLASHDLTRNFSNSSSNQSQQNNATGGKGTRPKRGKYRNYDRDSLVEAVKAVQRGEMSVHRAGSYYGVPHSTLEYKVKERHLMRPRKREPKNPNPDDKLSTSSLTSKPSEIPGSGILRVDKPKLVQKPPTKPTFPTSSPNGLKMPTMFDPALALGYNPGPFPFWPHAPAFAGLPVDFPPRNPGTSGSFQPESFFASQMMQRLQEESSRHPNVGSQKTPNSLLKSARDVAEFYEGAGGANGSFLEGIIRTTLDQNNQRSRAVDDQDGNRRLRPDDMMLAEEMREAVRKVRATRDPTPAATSSTPTPEAAGSPSPHPT